MILDEDLTIDTLWPDEMFQIQAGKTYQNKPVPFCQVGGDAYDQGSAV